MLTKKQFNDACRIIQKLRDVGPITLEGFRIHSIIGGVITVEVWPATAWTMGSYKDYTHEDFTSPWDMLRKLQILVNFDDLPKVTEHMSCNQ